MRVTLAPIVCYALFSSMAVPPSAAANQPRGPSREPSFPEGDAALGSAAPHIPEPLLFDLVRPLGAMRGEFETNVLVEHLEGGTIEWAPEIEYAFANGYAIELELPFVDNELVEYKVALQGTLGMRAGGNMIHGWQVIGRRDRDTGEHSADALYLNGFVLGDRLSLFGMAGLRRTELGSGGDNVVLLNTTLFYDRSQRLTYGLEINAEIESTRKARARLTPQLHYDLGERMTLQVGGGPSSLGPEREWALTWRLIYAR